MHNLIPPSFFRANKTPARKGLWRCIAARMSGCRSHQSLGTPFPELGDRPADIFLDNFRAGSPVAVDVSVVCGLQPSRSLATSHAGVRAKQRDTQKKNQYGESCRALGWGFVPFVAETTGAWGSEAHKVMSQLISLSASKIGETKQESTVKVWKSLSVALAKSIAEQLIGAFGPYVY